MFEKQVNKNLEIHTLICKKDVLLGINNFKSLHKFDEFKNVPIILHDDGSLDDNDIRLLMDINNVEIINRKDADKQINEHIKSYPNCLNYRTGNNQINLWHKIKTFDYYFFSKSKKILGMDSDLLFLRKPENLINLLNNDLPFYFPDCQSSYCFNEPKHEIPVLEKVNTGLFYIPSEEYYNIYHLEFALSNLIKNGINYFPSWIEQSAYAHMFYMDGRYVSLCSEKYRIPYFQDVDISLIECLHFVSYPAVRETYKNYLDYLKISQGDLIYIKNFIVNFRDEKIPLNIKINKYDNFLNFEFYWGLEKTNQNFLDHIFKIKNKHEEFEYKFQSNKNGFFIIPLLSNELEIHHTYEWYGEINYIKLDNIFIEN